jgi:hypothetical protein
MAAICRRDALCLALLVVTSCDTWISHLEDKFGQVDFVDEHGIHVANNGFTVDPALFANAVGETVAAWGWALDTDHIACNPAEELEAVFVAFRYYPFLLAGEGPYQGAHTYEGPWTVLLVGHAKKWPEILGHELGHHFAARCLNIWDEAGFALFAARHPEVPY